MRFARSSWGADLLVVCTLSLGLLSMLPNPRAGAQTGFGGVEIIVTDQAGTRLSSVDLCLTMPDGRNVRKMTDSNGSYNTTLSVGTTTIRVFRSGFANAQETVNMTNGATFEKLIPLQPGQSTPVPSDCGSIPAGATGPGNSCDVITAVQATSGQPTTDRSVPIRIEIKERPYAYRIAEFPQEVMRHQHFDPDDAFRNRNVPWQPVVGPAAGALTFFFTLTEPHYGHHPIYVQTRRHNQFGCVSRSRVVTVTLAPANYQTHTLKGTPLQQFVTEAKARGYEFRTLMTVFQRADRCQPGFYSLWPEHFRRERGLLGTDRNRVDQEISVRFQAFGGTPQSLMPYWTIQHSKAEHPSMPPIPYRNISGEWDLANTKPSDWVMNYAFSGEEYCQYGCEQSPFREFHWKRIITGYVALAGTREQGGTEFCDREQDARLTELVLRGPAGDNPISALVDLRSQGPPQFRLKHPPKGIPPSQLQLKHPPKPILPRGVEGE